MKLDIYDTAQESTYEEFIKKYEKEKINTIDKFTKLNLLIYATLNDKNPEERLKIVEFLITEGIDINYIEPKEKRNALHYMYMSVLDKDGENLYLVTKMLIEAGIDVNQKDEYNNIPLNYAITVLKPSTEELSKLYKLLIEAGSEYNNVDVFGKSCIDYAKEYSWRNGVIDIIKEYEMSNVRKYYGGFVVSNNILEGKAIRYSFREESAIKELNGWTLYSIADDQAYIENPKNFKVVDAVTMLSIAPVMLEIYDAKYGTDLCWMYEKGVHTGFWDLISNQAIAIEEILK